ncbi:hypothetical protein [Streptomyces sp. NBC_01217]|uniref:hypothetical protein n=1 Tax=Streptomyces sp. NBC_01217 TaxID=2903779 RepID=UPI002E0F0888|nr:hypothetical protein OG507_20965 [Streptomyces sp. NBC_01217]
MAVITAPVGDFTGPGVGGLVFQGGRAETDNPSVIAYAHRHGYEVKNDEPEAPHSPPSAPDRPEQTPTSEPAPEPAPQPTATGRSAARGKTSKG